MQHIWENKKSYRIPPLNLITAHFWLHSSPGNKYKFTPKWNDLKAKTPRLRDNDAVETHSVQLYEVLLGCFFFLPKMIITVKHTNIQQNDRTANDHVYARVNGHQKYKINNLWNNFRNNKK